MIKASRKKSPFIRSKVLSWSLMSRSLQAARFSVIQRAGEDVKEVGHRYPWLAGKDEK
jgi:hypothetical protein